MCELNLSGWIGARWGLRQQPRASHGEGVPGTSMAIGPAVRALAHRTASSGVPPAAFPSHLMPATAGKKEERPTFYVGQFPYL